LSGILTLVRDPVSGEDLCPYWARYAETTSDEDGRYAFLLSPGTYALRP
jgi:hypothetical protein